MTAYSVTDISNFFIDYYKRSMDPVNLQRVQMFVYFAQVESLVRLGRPLFEDEIRAYSSGPAVSRLNVYYEDAGNAPIDVYRDYDKSKLEPEVRDLLMDVAVYYNQYSTSQLMIKTYIAGGPWEYMYTKDSTGCPAIDNGMIRDFYADKPRVPNHIDYMMQVINDSSPQISAMSKLQESASANTYTNREISETWESY